MTTPAPTRPKGSLIRFAWAVVAWNVLIILWGAVVRATGSGAGCGNHWPLCNGVVVPINPRVDTIIEFTHRITTGLALPLVIALVVWTFRSTTRGALARVMASVGLFLTLNEALLGALLVKLGYVGSNQSVARAAFLSLHLTNTLMLVAALTLTAASLSRDLQRGEIAIERKSASIALLALLSTISVGVTGSLAALGDTLFPSRTLSSALHEDFSTNASYLLRIRWVHPACSIIAAIFVCWLLYTAWRNHQSRPARLVLALLTAQFALGIADVVLLAPVYLQIPHLLLANLFWISLIALSSRLAIVRAHTAAYRESATFPNPASSNA
jgi:cytochrome c oxidase assembly protein subunit 15